MLTAWDVFVAIVKWVLLAAILGTLIVWGYGKMDKLGAPTSPSNDKTEHRSAEEIMKPPSRNKKPW